MTIYCSPEDDIGFVYVWFNVTNHRYYIGSHRGHPNDGYIGSGKIFKRAYKKNPENFVRHIEYYGPDYRQEETDLIKFFDACNCHESYNLMHVDKTGCSISDETRKKFRQRKHSAETIEKISAARTGKKHTDETRANISAALKGKSISEEHRAKISAGRKGMKFSDQTRAKMSAVQRGRVFTEEHIAKLRSAQERVQRQKLECPRCGKTGGSNIMKRWHFDNCKFKSHK